MNLSKYSFITIFFRIFLYIYITKYNNISMSRLNIPLYKFVDEESNILLNSVTDKLNIQNPQFYYPIYKQVVTDDDTRNIVFDSKFKCKQITSKMLDCDSDNELYESLDNETTSPIEFNFKQSSSDVLDVQDTTLDMILNNDQTFEIENKIQEDEETSTLDTELEKMLNNTFTVNALVERIDRTTNKKTIKEEEIHIKKTALLEPLKIMKDEYIIPATIQNKHLDTPSIQNTMNKINSSNNSGHVEALFLYLGNKLVESGKCPAFPYYYGCINGEDPNYYHNITDEYDNVARTKWFRNRIKNDFDLLIIESDDADNMQDEMINNLRKPHSYKHTYSLSDSDNDNDSDNDSDDYETDENIESPTITPLEQSSTPLEQSNGLDNVTTSVNKNIISLDALETDNNALDNFLTSDNNTDDNFITELNDDDLEINDDDYTVSITDELSQQGAGGAGMDEDLIDELSDVDAKNLTMEEFENNTNYMYYVKCDKMPINLCLMEKLDQTLDNLLDDGYKMIEAEWFSMFFQVAFGLAIAQKYFNFVHNDLHSSNVMFKQTNMKYLYYQIANQIYKIPTFGKITKIIDFARGTFKLGDTWIFSDQFKDDGDAWGQYDYPTDGNIDTCEHKPNPSFDLVRLGTTVIQRLDELPKVQSFVEDITKDDYNNSLCYEEDTFQLYIDIAHNAHNAIPIEVLMRPEFDCFKVDKVPKGVYVFTY